MDEIGLIGSSMLQSVPVTDYSKIDVGEHYITHMYIESEQVMPPLDVVAPRLTHLTLSFLSPDHDLSW